MAKSSTALKAKDSSYEHLSQLIKNKSAKVGVIGLGYVGIPLIKAFIEGGFKTLGYDIDQTKVNILLEGKSFIKHISGEWISPSLKKGFFDPTTDARRLSEADAILICVPTPLNETRDPDISYIEASCNTIAKTLRPGQLVVLESTTYPGTTRDVVVPILAKTGLKEGQDFFVAFSPEREDPGNPKFSASTIPKVIGGIDQRSTDLAVSLYANAVVQTVAVENCEVAEACKILENTYRSVNIAMVNELKILFDRMGIDIWAVINAAKTKPFGFQAFYPGPGLGGHCIPIDPFYLSWVARKHGIPTKFIELAGEINSNMPYYVAERVALGLNDFGKSIKGSRISILGVAYKKDIDDPRESPSFTLMKILGDRGAQLSFNDPYIKEINATHYHHLETIKGLKSTKSFELNQMYLQTQDCVLIATDHSVYDYDFIVKNSKLVIDTRNATAKVKQGREKIWRA